MTVGNTLGPQSEETPLAQRLDRIEEMLTALEARRPHEPGQSNDVAQEAGRQSNANSDVALTRIEARLAQLDAATSPEIRPDTVARNENDGHTVQQTTDAPLPVSHAGNDKAGDNKSDNNTTPIDAANQPPHEPVANPTQSPAAKPGARQAREQGRANESDAVILGAGPMGFILEGVAKVESRVFLGEWLSLGDLIAGNYHKGGGQGQDVPDGANITPTGSPANKATAPSRDIA